MTCSHDDVMCLVVLSNMEIPVDRWSTSALCMRRNGVVRSQNESSRRVRGGNMRTEHDMIVHIQEHARQDENVRGVVINGSRVSPSAIRDDYQDYDIFYLVNDVQKFISDHTIEHELGDTKLLFRPDQHYPELFHDEQVYLMLFTDNMRIDLIICSFDTFHTKYQTDASQYPMQCLLDKDGKLGCVEDQDESARFVKSLDEQTYQQTCAEFYWEIQNVVKGLCRDHLPYALFLRDIALRDMLNRLVDGYIGIRHQYRVSVGTHGKYRKRYLDERTYEAYRRTYRANTLDDIWESVQTMMDLFERLALIISEEYQYEYPRGKERVMREYFLRARGRSQE